MEAQNILFLGDSLVEFFDWQGRFPGHRVANLGVAGEAVEGLLSRAGRIAEKYPQADMVFIMSGINNLAMEEAGFIGAYRELLKRLAAAYPAARVYVHSLLPTLLPWVPDAAIKEANAALKALAGECGAAYLDVYTLFMERGVRACLSQDGIHLSDTGYAVWSGAVEGVIGGLQRG